MKNKISMPSENIEWVKRRKEFIKNIEKFEISKDRIQTTTQLSYMHNALHESVLGWQNWINGWISVELTKKINIKDPEAIGLTNDELNELHSAFKEFAIKFIEIDIKYTELITKKLGKKKKTPEFTNVPEETLDNKYKGLVV